MSDLDKVIDKVKKLLALSKSPNQNEANAALAAANKLIDAHRISENDLTEDGGIIIDPTYIYETGRVNPWKNKLVNVLAKHYGCVSYNDNTFNGNGRLVSRFRLVGRRTDVSIARYLFNYLVEVCELLAGAVKGCGRIVVASYCLGFVRGVEEQLELSRKELISENTCGAMVLLERRSEESDNFLRKTIPVVDKKIYSKNKIDNNAFQAGMTEGKKTNLATKGLPE